MNMHEGDAHAEAWIGEAPLPSCRTSRAPPAHPRPAPADCPPQALQAQLADPATKPAAMAAVQALQRHLDKFAGLMAVVLPAPGAMLEVQDLGAGGLSAEQAAALHHRAHELR